METTIFMQYLKAAANVCVFKPLRNLLRLEYSAIAHKHRPTVRNFGDGFIVLLHK